VLYRETHTLLDELADATLDGTRKEHMEFLALGVFWSVRPVMSR